MTVSELANYCQFKGCEISLGSPEKGFVHINGEGRHRSPNYGRFHALNELASSASIESVIQGATTFKIHRGEVVKTLSREEFEQEYQRFLSLIEG